MYGEAVDDRRCSEILRSGAVTVLAREDERLMKRTKEVVEDRAVERVISFLTLSRSARRSLQVQVPGLSTFLSTTSVPC
jgi:hypothetical protein